MEVEDRTVRSGRRLNRTNPEAVVKPPQITPSEYSPTSEGHLWRYAGEYLDACTTSCLKAR
jgi:hypothetical protein